MKNFQQNALIGLAFALCGLCVYQWYEQTAQRKEIESLSRAAFEKSGSIRDYTNSIETLNHQIAQMDAQLSELKESARTNGQLVAIQKRDFDKLQITNETLVGQIAEYKKAVETLTEKLKEAYSGISRQNESVTNLVSQRDELLKRYNESVKERNDIVTKYNELAAHMQKIQDSASKR